MEKHGSNPVEFEMKVVKTFRDPLSRQVTEAVLIKNHQGELLNSKSEFYQPSLIKIRSEIVKGLDNWGVITIVVFQSYILYKHFTANTAGIGLPIWVHEHCQSSRFREPRKCKQQDKILSRFREPNKIWKAKQEIVLPSHPRGNSSPKPFKKLFHFSKLASVYHWQEQELKLVWNSRS